MREAGACEKSGDRKIESRDGGCQANQITVRAREQIYIERVRGEGGVMIAICAKNWRVYIGAVDDADWSRAG